MKISRLIEQLRELKEMHGDAEVKIAAEADRDEEGGDPGASIEGLIPIGEPNGDIDHILIADINTYDALG